MLKGTFLQSEFAADITAVHSGKAPAEYQDAKAFFERAYITEGMRLLLTQIVQRLSKRKGHASHREPRRGRQMAYSTLTCLQRNDSDQPAMHALGKSPSAKLSVRAPAMARPWARVRPHRLSFLLGGDDPENRIVEEIPAGGSVVGGKRCNFFASCRVVTEPQGQAAQSLTSPRCQPQGASSTGRDAKP